MNLDNLHKVMKGDMTIDQACEGMTDDFEIGHVSHRKDGDYKKVAQGKWVPVKAGGGQQMSQGSTYQETAGNLAARGYVKEINSKTNNIEKRDKLLNKKFKELYRTQGPSSFESMGELYGRVKKAKPHTDEWYIAMNNYDMASKLYHGVIGSDNVDYYNKQIENLRMRPNYGQDPQETKIRESIKSIAEGEKKPDSQGDKNVLTSADDVTPDIIEQVHKEAYKANKTHGTLEMMENYDITQIQKFANANVDTGFANVDGIRGYLKKKAGLPGGVDLNVASKELAKFNNWQNARNIMRRYENKELDVDDTGHFYVPESARPKAEGNAPAKKSAFESFREKEGWKTDNEADRKRDYSLFLKSMRQADFDKYASHNQGDPDYDSEAVKKERETREWYDKAYSSDAAPRLTRDTKIRLSRIKR